MLFDTTMIITLYENAYICNTQNSTFQGKEG
jgi:hypothetical protein